MRDGALPAIAMCLMLGMMLAHASSRTALAASLVVLVVATVESMIVVPVEWRTAIVVALLLLAGIIAAFILVSKKSAAPTSTIPGKSIAVLPFVNMTSERKMTSLRMVSPKKS